MNYMNEHVMQMIRDNNAALEMQAERHHRERMGMLALLQQVLGPMTTITAALEEAGE